MRSFFESFKKSRAGATLIELIIYFALLGIILTIVVDIMLRTGEFSLESAAESNTQQNAQFIINRFSYDIRRADAVNTPTNLGESSPTLSLDISGETHTYTLVGTDLEYEQISNSQIANLNSSQVKVNSLNFQRLGNNNGKPTIKITFEVQPVKKEKGSTNIEKFETAVSLR